MNTVLFVNVTRVSIGFSENLFLVLISSLIVTQTVKPYMKKINSRMSVLTNLGLPCTPHLTYSAYNYSNEHTLLQLRSKIHDLANSINACTIKF